MHVPHCSYIRTTPCITAFSLAAYPCEGKRGCKVQLVSFVYLTILNIFGCKCISFSKRGGKQNRKRTHPVNWAHTLADGKQGLVCPTCWKYFCYLVLINFILGEKQIKFAPVIVLTKTCTNCLLIQTRLAQEYHQYSKFLMDTMPLTSSQTEAGGQTAGSLMLQQKAERACTGTGAF